MIEPTKWATPVIFPPPCCDAISMDAEIDSWSSASPITTDAPNDLSSSTLDSSRARHVTAEPSASNFFASTIAISLLPPTIRYEVIMLRFMIDIYTNVRMQICL